MINRQHQRGFTLIETMISMLLGLIILGGTITAYQTISGLREQRDAIYELQNELLYVHRTLAQAVATADTVEVDDETLKIAPFESAEGGRYAGCPQRGSDAPWKWVIATKKSGSKSLKCNGAEVLALTAPGITSVNFDTAEACAAATSPCVHVTLEYTPCREEDECDQTLSFHLASRITPDSKGSP